MFRRILLTLSILFFLQSSFALATTPSTSKPALGASINWAHPLSKGLVAVFLMNEGGGNRTANLVNRKYDGVFTNVIWKPKSKGISTYFDGNTSSINCGVIPKENRFSIVCVVNTFYYANGPRRIFDKELSGTRWPSYQVYLNAGGTVSANYFDSPASEHKVTSDSAIPLNKDCFIASVYNGATLSLYINTIKKDLATTGNVYDGGDVVTIGSGNPLAWEFAGNIYYLYFYNRALSPQEIKQLYIDPYCFIKQDYKLYYTAPAASSFGAKLYQGSVTLMGSISQ